MDQQTTKAIKSFDDHLVWISSRRFINQDRLNQLVTALKTISERCEINQAETEAQVNALSETSFKLNLLIRACGFTEKGIKSLLEYDIEDLEGFVSWYNKNENALPLNNPMAADFFCTEVRIRKELIKTKWN